MFEIVARPVQGIAHEVQCRDGVRVWEHDEGLRRSGKPTLLGAPQLVRVFPEPPAWSGDSQGGQLLYHWSIEPGPNDHRPIVRGPTQPDRLTGPLNRKAA